MAFPCCMGLTVGIRLAAVLSLLLALAMGGVSGWLLKDTQDERGKVVVSLFNDLLQSATNIDRDQVLRIKLWCAATVLAAAVLQFFTSLLLLVCSSFKGGHATGRLYVFINIFVLLAIAGAIGCFLSAGVKYEGETESAKQVKIFMGVAGVDFLFLIYFLLVAFFFIRS